MESGFEADALRDAEQARDDMAASVVFPRGHDEAIGAAVAVQIATTALGLAVDAAWARWALAGGVVLFGVVAGLQLWRFTRLNGVRVGGFASRVVFGTATTASFGVRRRRWSSPTLPPPATSGGWSGSPRWPGVVVYVLSGRRWLRAYRREPARLGARRVRAVAGAGGGPGRRGPGPARRRALMAELDPHLQAPARLKLVTLLTAVSEAEFAVVRDRLDVSDSVLSKHLSALGEAGYVRVRKGVHHGRRTTWVSLTASGRKAVSAHVRALRALIADVP